MDSPLLLAQARPGANAAIVAFGCYIVGVMFLAWLSSRVAQRSSFLSEYFLGGRSLGVWAFALTFAATAASGGSFIGFPSLVYMHGWSVALWISSYMLVPLVAMGLTAKRINQMARKTDAITVPDLVLERFQSPALGLITTALIVFFTTFNLIAQFKGGSVILQTLLSDVPAFQYVAAQFAQVSSLIPWVAGGVDPAYLLCLCVFALAVVVYTTYGGFRAVVWTDVLQGVVMVIGILILLPLSIIAVGGLAKATSQISNSTPPIRVKCALSFTGDEPPPVGQIIPSGEFLRAQRGASPIVLRLAEDGVVNELGKLLATERDPVTGMRIGGADRPLINALWVMDVSQERADAHQAKHGLFAVEEFVRSAYRYGALEKGVYTSLPGPSEKSKHGFLPFSAAISFFFFWCFATAGQPGNLVRCMAFRDSRTLAKAIFTVSVYYSLIYFPIVVIFCCARSLLPGWEMASDRIMPEMASHVTAVFGVPWLGGLLIAAPFAAVMSTMDSFLLLISSSVVRDIYVRWINPHATQRKTKTLTYCTTAIVGITAMVAAINPPRFLQDIIVFTGAGLSTAFLVPIVLSLYWPRFNHQGAIAGMLSGFSCNLALYAIGSVLAGEMAAYEPLGFSPFLVGTLLSLVTAIVVCLKTPPPNEQLVLKFFYRKRA